MEAGFAPKLGIEQRLRVLNNAGWGRCSSAVVYPSRVMRNLVLHQPYGKSLAPSWVSSLTSLGGHWFDALRRLYAAAEYLPCYSRPSGNRNHVQDLAPRPAVREPAPAAMSILAPWQSLEWADVDRWGHQLNLWALPKSMFAGVCSGAGKIGLLIALNFTSAASYICAVIQ